MPLHVPPAPAPALRSVLTALSSPSTSDWLVLPRDREPVRVSVTCSPVRSDLGTVHLPGAAVAVGTGVAVGAAVAVGAGVAVGVAVGAAVGVAVGAGRGSAAPQRSQV